MRKKDTNTTTCTKIRASTNQCCWFKTSNAFILWVWCAGCCVSGERRRLRKFREKRSLLCTRTQRMADTNKEQFAQSVIGKTEEEARAMAGNTYRIRVSERDGEHLMLTMDYNLRRLNVCVNNGIITSVHKWGWKKPIPVACTLVFLLHRLFQFLLGFAQKKSAYGKSRKRSTRNRQQNNATLADSVLGKQKKSSTRVQVFTSSVWHNTQFFSSQ